MNIGTYIYDKNDVQILLQIVKQKYYENIELLSKQKFQLEKEFIDIITNNNHYDHTATRSFEVHML